MGQAKIRKANGTYPVIPPIPKNVDGIQELAQKALIEIKHRSFSGRNPELGKMINCGRCSLRHRSTQCHINAQWEEAERVKKLADVR